MRKRYNINYNRNNTSYNNRNNTSYSSSNFSFWEKVLNKCLYMYAFVSVYIFPFISGFFYFIFSSIYFIINTMFKFIKIILNFMYKILYFFFYFCLIVLKICFVSACLIWFFNLIYFNLIQSFPLIDVCSSINWIWTQIFIWFNSLNYLYEFPIQSKKNIFLLNILFNICLLNILLKILQQTITRKLYILILGFLFWCINFFILFYFIDTLIGLHCSRLEYCNSLDYYTGIFNHNLFKGLYFDIKLNCCLKERLTYFNYLLSLNNIKCEFFSEAQILNLLTLDPSDMNSLFNAYVSQNYEIEMKIGYAINRAIIRHSCNMFLLLGMCVAFLITEPPFIYEIVSNLSFAY